MRISDWSSYVCSSDLIRSARMTTTDPFALFDAWFAEARASEPNDSNAMALATATPDGRPSVRMALLKGPGTGGSVRSEERRVGKECVGQYRSRWSAYH